MSFRARVLMMFAAFLVLGLTVAGLLVFNSFRQERAFRWGANAQRTQFLVQEMEYFLNRKMMAVQTYILLEDDSEKNQLRLADKELKNRRDVLENWVRSKKSRGRDLAGIDTAMMAVNPIIDRLMELVDQGQRVVAIPEVERDLIPAAQRARVLMEKVKTRVSGDRVYAEQDVARVTEQVHVVSASVVLLALVVGLGLAWSLYQSVMKPMKIIRMWATQIAQGNLDVRLNAKGGGEVLQVARDFDRVIQNLKATLSHPPASEIISPDDTLRLTPEEVQTLAAAVAKSSPALETAEHSVTQALEALPVEAARVTEGASGPQSDETESVLKEAQEAPLTEGPDTPAEGLPSTRAEGAFSPASEEANATPNDVQGPGRIPETPSVISSPSFIPEPLPLEIGAPGEPMILGEPALEMPHEPAVESPLPPAPDTLQEMVSPQAPAKSMETVMNEAYKEKLHNLEEAVDSFRNILDLMGEEHPSKKNLR